MFNVLLDELPEEWHGYPIDSNFRTGIMISKALVDEDLSDMESFYTAADLLFPERMPPVEEIGKGIKWYLTEYNHDNHVDNDEKDVTPIFDYDLDQWRVYAAFKSQYGIDLNTVDMHWFVFMGLLGNLQECTLTRVMNTRARKITSKMGPAERRALERAKKAFAIKSGKERPMTSEEKQRVDEFMKYVHITKK